MANDDFIDIETEIVVKKNSDRLFRRFNRRTRRLYSAIAEPAVWRASGYLRRQVLKN